MPKTRELSFIKEVIKKMLAFHEAEIHKQNLFTFISQMEDYYDELCDIIYKLSISPVPCAVGLTKEGKPTIDTSQVVYTLLQQHEIYPCEDIAELIDKALYNLKTQVSEN